MTFEKISRSVSSCCFKTRPVSAPFFWFSIRIWRTNFAATLFIPRPSVKLTEPSSKITHYSLIVDQLNVNRLWAQALKYFQYFRRFEKLMLINVQFEVCHQFTSAIFKSSIPLIFLSFSHIVILVTIYYIKTVSTFLPAHSSNKGLLVFFLFPLVLA